VCAAVEYIDAFSIIRHSYYCKCSSKYFGRLCQFDSNVFFTDISL
jgi:hypothetical protein